MLNKYSKNSAGIYVSNEASIDKEEYERSPIGLFLPLGLYKSLSRRKPNTKSILTFRKLESKDVIDEFWANKSFMGKIIAVIISMLALPAIIWVNFESSFLDDKSLLRYLYTAVMSIIHLFIYVMAYNFFAKNISLLLKMVNNVFIVFASLCFIRITLILPLVLSNIKDGSAYEYYQNSNTYGGKVFDDMLYFSEKFLYTFPSVIVYIFIFSRILIPLLIESMGLNGKNYYIKTWNGVMIWWGVAFTVFTTISNQWGDYNVF